MSYNSRPQGPSLDNNLISKLADHVSHKGVGKGLILGFVCMALAAGTVVGIENAAKNDVQNVEYSYSPTSM